MQWISNAKYLSPPIDQVDLVSTIIQHYPTSLSMAIRGRGPQTTNALLSILTEFEESSSFCDQEQHHENRPRQQYPNTSTNNRGGSFHNRRNGNFSGNRFPPRGSTPPSPTTEPVNQLNVSGNEEVPHT